jgi:hypothetical protein
MSVTKSDVIRGMIQRERDKILRIDARIREIVANRMDRNLDFFDVIGTWDCPDSPFGLCMYNTFDDVAKDTCLFCSQPHERK